MAEIDSLEIKIKAESKTAETALESLCKKLGELDTLLAGVNGESLKSLSEGILQLTNAMHSMKVADVKTTDFNRLKTQVERLGQINTAQLDRVASGLRQITNSFAKLGDVSTQSQAVSTMASAISRLGYKSVSSAIANMPRLTVELSRMLTALSKVPAINASVIQMTNAISNLASQGARVGTAAQSMTHGISRVGYASERSSRKVFSLAAAFGKFYATYFLVIRGLKGLWKSIEGAMDYVETFNYMSVTLNKMGKDFATTMGEAGQESAEAYAQNFRNTLNDLNRKMTGYTVTEFGELMASGMGNLGLDATQLMQFQAKIGAVTNSVGMLGNQSVMAQKALSMLSADLSSLTNTDLSTVMGNLSSGLIGQSRALYKYGIDITNASLKQTAFEHGITKSLTSMSQQEKMQLRLLTILKQSQVAWGDQANTVNTVANQYRIFKQQLQNLGRILGNLFLPIVQTVLPKVNGLIIALQKLFTTLGFQLHGQTWLKDINDGISGGYIEEDADLVEELDEALDGASGSAKKLKQQLQGFDELNVLSSKDDSGSDISGGLIDLSADIEEALGEYESVWNKAFEGMENKAVEFAEKLSAKLEPIKKLFSDIISGDWYAVGQDVSNLVSGFFDTISNALAKVDWQKVGQNVGDFLAGIDWVKILNSVGKAIYNALRAVITTWFESFKKAPLSTLTLTFAALKFTHLGQILTGGLFAKSLGSALGLTSVGGSLFSYALPITISFLVGQNLGQELGKALFPDDAEWYENFSWFGDDKYGFFHVLKQEIHDNAFEIKKELVNFKVSSKRTMNEIASVFGGKELFSETEILEDLKEITTGSTTHTSSSGNVHGGKGGSFLSKAEFLENYTGTLRETVNNLKVINDDLEAESNKTDNIISIGLQGVDLSLANASTSIPTKMNSIYNGIVFVNKQINDELNEKKWTYDGVAEGIKKTFDSAINVIKGIDFENVFKGVKGAFGIPGYASGGFTTADVFFANENGVPELVGTVGGRTAVANGQEITGISDAVYSTGNTQASLLSTAVELLGIIANNGNGFNEDAVFNSVRRSAQNYTNRTGNPAFN